MRGRKAKALRRMATDMGRNEPGAAYAKNTVTGPIVLDKCQKLYYKVLKKYAR